jgi:hypothetical protein
MPKQYTSPTLYNELLQISITQLKELGYLNTEQIKGGTISWSSNGNKIGGVAIQVNTQSQPYIELDYSYRNEPKKYRVYLTSIKSNLNKGEILYFLCPYTNKHCRKLYLIGGNFLHREALKGGMYESQTKSKRNRQLDKLIGTIFNCETLYNEANKMHFKRTYAGKPTKRYLQIMEQIRNAGNITTNDVERALLR